MSHVAQTEDLIEVASWTGEVPRAGDTVYMNPAKSGAAAGKWRVDAVEWAMSSGAWLAPSRAELTLSPVDDVAKVWLEAARMERKHAEALEAR
jgi:hypothetical protein